MAQFSPRHILIAFSPARADRVLEVGAYLERFGYRVSTADSDAAVLAACGRAHVDGLVFDLALIQGLEPVAWLGKLRLISPMTATLLVGEYGELESLRAVSQEGDGDYTLMPLSPVELRGRLRRLIEARAAGGDSEPLRSDTRSVDDIVGRSAAMQRIRDRVRKVAALNSTVLITGESGVGKELIARAIHRASPRRDRAFVAINCSALPESLLESELFGHEKGAFTGAAAQSRGKFELAHRGTLFLDEIGDMNPYMQAKLLRVLEEREFMRVGGARNIQVDVRVLAATNADLPARMTDGRFREDLFYRLKVLTLEIPPLRARSEDIGELVRAFINQFCRTNGLPLARVTDEALEVMRDYRWPGNIRELRNALENLIVSVPGDVIDVEDLPDTMLRPAAPRPAVPEHPLTDESAAATARSMEEMERELIIETLKDEHGNRTRAARRLKIGVRTLQRKIKKYGIDSPAIRGDGLSVGRE